MYMTIYLTFDKNKLANKFAKGLQCVISQNN